MRSAREALVLLLVALVPAALALALHPDFADRHRAGLAADEVRLEEVRDWHADVLWLDARPAADFARSHIPDALHFDAEQFATSLGAVLAAWQPGRRIVVYCSSVSCTTSRELAQRLRAAGLDDVHFLRGGWEAWEAAAR